MLAIQLRRQLYDILCAPVCPHVYVCLVLGSQHVPTIELMVHRAIRQQHDINTETVAAAAAISYAAAVATFAAELSISSPSVAAFMLHST